MPGARSCSTRASASSGSSRGAGNGYPLRCLRRCPNARQPTDARTSPSAHERRHARAEQPAGRVSSLQPQPRSTRPAPRRKSLDDFCAAALRHLETRKFDLAVFVSGDFSDAERLYAEAVARRDAIRDTWSAEGEPLLATGSTGQLVEHPYVKMLREHDLLVDRLAAAVRKRHRGPEPSAVLKPRSASRLPRRSERSGSSRW